MAGGILRKAALERLSSPERLDELMHVTSPIGWVALIALGASIVAVIVWSVVGSISIKVHGRGILIRGGQVLDVTAGWDGRIESIEVKVGDVVKEDQLVAKVVQTELITKIGNKRQELQSQRAQSSLTSMEESAMIKKYEADRADLQEKIKTTQELVDKGLATRSTLLQYTQQLTGIENSISQAKIRMRGTGIQPEQLQHEVKELEQQLGSRSEVRSPFNGRVVEVAVRQGDLIQPGGRIVILEDTEAPIKAAVYIPATEGKKIELRLKEKDEEGKFIGAMAYVSPSTASAEEYGFMVGEVELVSDFPLTREALIRTLRNETLVEELTGKAAPLEVRVNLLQDKTRSGFKWSSGKGPDFEIYSGTICNASIEVETKKPISYVLPLVRKAAGISS